MAPLCQFQLCDFLDVPAPQFRRTVFRLAISVHDQLAMNDAFRKQFSQLGEFRLRLSPDGYTLLLNEDDPGNLTFTEKGVRTTHPLGDMLRERQVSLPASYVMSWSEDWSCWLGQYEGLRKPPVRETRKRGATRARRGG